MTNVFWSFKAWLRGLWYNRLYYRIRAKRFRKRNYPVRIDHFKSGDMVLIRNLDTHEYGGWYQDENFVKLEWGEAVLERLRKDYDRP